MPNADRGADEEAADEQAVDQGGGTQSGGGGPLTLVPPTTLALNYAVISQGDTLPIWGGSCSDASGDTIDLTQFSTSLKAIMHEISGRRTLAVTVTGTNSGTWTYAWAAGDTALPGFYAVQVIGIGPSGQASFPDNGYEPFEILPSAFNL